MRIAPRSLFEAPPNRPALAPGLRLDRNWHLDSDPVWSRAAEATLRVAAARFPRPVTLAMTFHVFHASAERPRLLRIESPGQPPVEARIATSGPCTVLLTSPRHRPGAEAGTVTLRLDRLASPARLGLSEDERLLGLRIVSILPEPAAPSLPLDFTRPEVCAALLCDGWAPPDPGAGAWSLKHRARILLPGYLFPGAPPGPGGLIFEASALPRPEDGPPLAVTLESGGTALATWQVRPEAGAPPPRWSCPLPPGPAHADREITLTIEGALSPDSLGINADPRPLGLLLRGLALAAPPP